MKRSLSITLSDEELIDLYRILLDKDAVGALAFLDEHARKQVIAELEGG
jgi:hypothetical protein